MPCHSLSFTIYANWSQSFIHSKSIQSDCVSSMWLEARIRWTGTLHIACTTTEYGVQSTIHLQDIDMHLHCAMYGVHCRAIPASCRSLFLRVWLRAAAGKENKDWNFQGRCKGPSCLRPFFFKRIVRRDFHAVSVQHMFMLDRSSSSSPLPSQHGHVSPPFLPYRSSLSPCQREESCRWIGYYDVQHICLRQPRCSSFTLRLYSTLYVIFGDSIKTS